MASDTYQRPQDKSDRPPDPDGRPYQEHERAVLTAEARALAVALRPYGILTGNTLEDLVRARRWHRGSFRQALGVAVRMGLIDLLPFGFCRYVATPTPPEGGCSTPDRRRTRK